MQPTDRVYSITIILETIVTLLWKKYIFIWLNKRFIAVFLLYGNGRLNRNELEVSIINMNKVLLILIIR